MKYKIIVQDSWGTTQIVTFTKGKSEITHRLSWGRVEITSSSKPDTKRLNSMDEWNIYSELEVDDVDLDNCKSDDWSFSDDISDEEQEQILDRIYEEDDDFLEDEEDWERDMDIFISAKISVEKIE